MTAAISQLRGTLMTSLGVSSASWHALQSTIVGRPAIIKEFGYENARKQVKVALMRLRRRSATWVERKRDGREMRCHLECAI